MDHDSEDDDGSLEEGEIRDDHDKQDDRGKVWEDGEIRDDDDEYDQQEQLQEPRKPLARESFRLNPASTHQSPRPCRASPGFNQLARGGGREEEDANEGEQPSSAACLFDVPFSTRRAAASTAFSTAPPSPPKLPHATSLSSPYSSTCPPPLPPGPPPSPPPLPDSPYQSPPRPSPVWPPDVGNPWPPSYDLDYDLYIRFDSGACTCAQSDHSLTPPYPSDDERNIASVSERPCRQLYQPPMQHHILETPADENTITAVEIAPAAAPYVDIHDTDLPAAPIDHHDDQYYYCIDQGLQPAEDHNPSINNQLDAYLPPNRDLPRAVDPYEGHDYLNDVLDCLKPDEAMDRL